MSTIHNNANLGDIAKTVIMPGDPLRAKFIAEHFLDNAVLVNSVRGMLAYTGSYKGQKLTIMASGMGMPSMGIYSYELFRYYGVENIIRIGSCGAYSSCLSLFDIVLSTTVYTEGNYALTFNNDSSHFVEANYELNQIILNTAKELNIDILAGSTICTDVFDGYMTNQEKFFERFPKDFQPLTSEMESFALLYNAKLFEKKASCIMSVVDSNFIKKVATAEQREVGLTKMLTLALESAIRI